jgi:hypothetical protein
MKNTIRAALLVVAAIGAMVAPATASAQLTKETTPAFGETLAYTWATDGRQYVTAPLGIGYETTLDLPFLFKISAGHGAFIGTETLKTFDLEDNEVNEVWGWEVYSTLYLGGDGLFVRASWGPMVHGMEFDAMQISFPGRVQFGIRF